MANAVPDRIDLFRMVHHRNVAHILEHGICSREHPDHDPVYVEIGLRDIIHKRDHDPVGKPGSGYLGEYVPFYFSGRQPMLLNIITGQHGMPRRPQQDLVIIHCPLQRILDARCQYVYTDGNAKVRISKRFTDPAMMDQLPWADIRSPDFRIAEHGRDRIRRKQAEFLVRGYVPVSCIGSLIVMDAVRKAAMEALVNARKLNIKVIEDEKRRWFFP